MVLWQPCTSETHLCVPLQVSPFPSSLPGPLGSSTTTMRSEPDCSYPPFFFLFQILRISCVRNSVREEKKDNIIPFFLLSSLSALCSTSSVLLVSPQKANVIFKGKKRLNQISYNRFTKGSWDLTSRDLNYPHLSHFHRHLLMKVLTGT